MFLRQIFDEKLAQYAYIIGCQQTGEAIVIDPERDIDRFLARQGFDVQYVNDLWTSYAARYDVVKHEASYA
jgi:hypothetical protein